MYAWIFRRLPGPLWVRVLAALALLLTVLLVLLEVVFPWAAQFSPFTADITVADPGARGS